MKKGIIIGLVILLVVGGGIGYFFYDLKKKESEYETKLSSTLKQIESSTFESAMLASDYQKYWGDIIKMSIPSSTLASELGILEKEVESYLDYSNTAYFTGMRIGLEEGDIDTIIELVAYAKYKEIKSVKKNHNEVEKSIKDLKNPPKKYTDIYDDLLQIYEVYNTFVSLSTSPVGSYNDYSENINSTYETLSSKIKTTKLQLQ
ncbi:hypothetical protein [Lysinibacillus fusiformis]|uniref:hypothetical protein n=1 Tax=Lysinibacillus fusiformis TaxID=28031 RepID=UPI00089174DF|nr:hypothetical protein [Lysinibacillus fusiformis]WEA41755.1 hypothetical protein PWJ66_23075 [Lysinibacillus fusiformis]SCX63563.1 hypothetical protein SAMN02787108_03278 [Lysinibacillus fusiformis]SDB46440.1 hypothetical protein SAMN02787070_03473 [Lysinibacillus fusiformis]SFI73757.1 hypothetical protein SAMN02787080_03492 [Lysinibacillus fusiformis]SFT16039.1 hypothetical protein SAMN02787099_03193 [Lysinibacillus fusiformis]